MSFIANAQSKSTSFKMPGIPGELQWHNLPTDWKFENNVLTITAGEKTDLFIDPIDGKSIANSPKALFKPDANFLFQSKVRVDFKSTYDAAVLIIYGGENNWAKFCFEYSPQGKPTVVSVVNRGKSDDSNHIPITGNTVYVRIAGLGNGTYAFHYSLDAKFWNMVRYFSLDTGADLKVGFSSQSPTGKSCSSAFTEILYKKEKLNDVRNGE